MKRKILSFLIGLCLIVPVFFGLTACGSSSPADEAIKISSKEELIAFAAAVNSGEYEDEVEQMGGGLVVKLEADIDMSGYEWLDPIGTSEHKFAGEFDGQNHQITNLSNNGKTTNEVSENVTSGTTGCVFGLFGYTKGTTLIKDLTVTVNATGTDGLMFAGLVASSGYSKTNPEFCNLTIDNVTIEGTITGKDKVAGFVGEAPYSTASGTTIIKNSTNRAAITANGGASARAAGFIAAGGTNEQGQINLMSLQSCRNEGNVTSTGWAAAFIASVNQSRSIFPNFEILKMSTFRLGGCENDANAVISGEVVSNVCTYDEGAYCDSIEDASSLQLLGAALTLRYHNNLSITQERNAALLANEVSIAGHSRFGDAVTAGLIEDTISYEFYYKHTATPLGIDTTKYACYVEIDGGVITFGSVKQAVAAGLALGDPFTIVLTKDCNEDVVAFLRDSTYDAGTKVYYTSWRSEELKFALDLNGFDYTNETVEYVVGGERVFSAWRDTPRTITFNSDGGSPVASIIKAQGDAIVAPAAPTKEGYDFAGWFNGTTEFVFATMPTEDITLVAHWTAHTYTITYAGVEGATNPNTKTTYTIEDETFALADATDKVGYTFTAWNNGSANVTEIAQGTTGNITLTAVWNINQYTVHFNSNGGSDVGSITQDYGTSVAAPAAPTKEGYDFAGWFRNQTQVQEFPFDMPEDGITLIAHWTAHAYTVTYHNVEGAININPIYYTIEDPTITLVDATKDSYSFGGWFSAEIYDAGHRVTQIVHGSTGDKELYAKFDPTPFTITYELNGGVNGANPDSYTIEDATFALADPTKATENGVYYTFVGWFDNAEFEGSAATGITTGSYGNKTFWAKWELRVDTAENLTKALAVASNEPIYLTADIVEENPVAITGDATLIGNNNNLYAQISGNGNILLKNIHTTNIKIVQDGGFGGNLVFDGGLIQQVNNPGTTDADSAFYSLRNPDASFTFKNMTVAANVTKGIKIGGSAKSVTIDNCTFDSSTLAVIQGGTNSDIQSLSLVDIQIYEGEPTDITIMNSYFAYSPQGSTAVPTFVDASGTLADSDTGAAIKLKVEKAMHFGTVTITGNTFTGNYRDILVGTAPYANQFQTAAATASNGRSAEGLQYNTIDGWTIENNTTDITAQVAATRGVATLSYIGGPSSFNKYTTRVSNVCQIVDGCGIWVINMAQKVGDTWYYVEDGVYYRITSSNNVTTFTEVSVWDGTASAVPAENNNTITITTAQEFAAFRNSVNAGNTYEGKIIVLATDIDLNNIEWIPIGYGDIDHNGMTNQLGPNFKGTFNGQNHTVYNLKITEFTQGGVASGASAGVALFGQLLGSVENLNVDGAVVNGNHFVGVIAGYALSATITNCNVVNATISCTYASADNENGDKAGVILGYGGALNDTVANATTVTNCSATNCAIDAYRDAGQIIGCLHCGVQSGNTATNVTVTANHSFNDENDGTNINNDIVGRVKN